VARAIEHETARQVLVIESGGRVVQETRLWNADRGETAVMRSKEEAHDYRYFPEPDLPPLVITAAWMEEVKASLPELPAPRRARFEAEYSLPGYDAGVLTAAREVADYFETVARDSGNAKAASNWVMNEVLRKVNEAGPSDEPGLAGCKVSPASLAELIRLVDSGVLSGKMAKDVFETMWATGEAPRAIVEREGLSQLSDEGAIRAAVAEVLAASPDQVAAYRKGRTAAIGWFVGQVMRKTAGKANPQVVNRLLREALENTR
jgi:aspartyl-tRNA(Asn)/glutamyl-tRNA(Gln) amidotransferase subunit B